MFERSDNETINKLFCKDLDLLYAVQNF